MGLLFCENILDKKKAHSTECAFFYSGIPPRQFPSSHSESQWYSRSPFRLGFCVFPPSFFTANILFSSPFGVITKLRRPFPKLLFSLVLVLSSILILALFLSEIPKSITLSEIWREYIPVSSFSFSKSLIMNALPFTQLDCVLVFSKKALPSVMIKLAIFPASKMPS